jgi:hypothetical protein
VKPLPTTFFPATPKHGAGLASARSRSGSIFSKALGELGSEAPFFGSRPPTPAFHRKASQGVQNGGRTPAGRVPPCTPTTRPHARSHSGALNSMYFLFFEIKSMQICTTSFHALLCTSFSKFKFSFSLAFSSSMSCCSYSSILKSCNPGFT